MLGSPSTRSATGLAGAPNGPPSGYFSHQFSNQPSHPYSMNQQFGHHQFNHIQQISKPLNSHNTSVSSLASSGPTPNRSQRCGACEGCASKQCGLCTYCKDSPQFGGPGVKKQSCIERRCRKVMENKLQVSVVLNFDFFKELKKIFVWIRK